MFGGANTSDERGKGGKGARPAVRRQRTRDENDDGGVPNGEDDPRGAQQAQTPFTPQIRGLDGGLAKACPNMEGLTQKTYRSFRRRLELFERQCHRRSTDAAVEGALLMISRLNNLAWEATESIDYTALESSAQPFKPIYKVLDDIYQYQEEIEVPARCEEFFGEFSRMKNEEMQAYLIRHKTMLAKMKEVKINIPSPLAGWHLLTRAAVPRWTHVQVKALCQGELEYDRVQKALMKMFGGDHRPNVKDIKAGGSSAKDDGFFEEDYETVYEEDEAYDTYAYEDYEWGYEEEAYEADEYEEEDPEIDEAVDQVDEAYINYLESRRRMRELALSRGFFPVVALPPEDGKAWSKGGSGGGGKGKSKGKSKGKGGKSKGKGKGSGGGFRRSFDNRRPMSGLRRPTSSTSTNINDSPKSTLSGSTAAHGPRFKRYRVQANGVKEVSEDQVTMVDDVTEEVADNPDIVNVEAEYCFFTTMNAGKAIVDSGATRTITGENTWKLWLEHLNPQEINVNPCQRDFRFGGGEVLRSHYEVTFPAYVNGQRLQLTASVVPGSTPFLISRPTLEAWCAKQDFSKGTMQVMNGQWFKPERGHRGHYVLDLLNRDEVCMMEESPSDPWHIELTLELDALETNDEAFLEIEDHQTLVAEVTKKATQSKSLLFFELYVDKGNLATSLAEKYDDVTVATFSLPEWDFSKVSVRTAFLKLLKAERPHFVWIAPPCTKWSKMQNLCALTPEYQSYLQDVRAEEESSHLWLTKRVSDYCENDDAGFGFEHPKEALSWKTETIESMNKDIYKDAICDRCQTGLVYRDSSGIVVGKVKKSTKIRTNSDSVFEALHLQCQCNPGEHIPMEGKSRALRAMQNYERGFTDRVAPAIYDTMVESWRKRETMKILVSEELNDMEVDDEKQKDRKPDISPEDKELMRTHGKKAYQIVSKLHRQLGHPSNDKLCRALHDAKFPSEVIEVAKNFSCSNCNSDVQKKIPKPAPLPQASHFNELMEIDVFHIKWDDKKYKILAAIDVYSRYEINALMKRETEEEELGILEKQWFNVFGAPEKVKTDSSGAHMSESYQQRLNDFGSKLLLVPKEAHYKMGIVERLHAVRRLQLLKMKRDFPDLELSRAITLACQQRNRLRSVNGTSPSHIVFGTAPQHPKGLLDEPWDNRPDLPSAVQEDHALRLTAARCFYEANHDQALRRALLGRPRSEPPVFEIGQWAYYWRTTDEKLQVQRWKGPALICMLEPSANSARTTCVWLAHGASLVRATIEHVRLENPREAAARIATMPDTIASRPLHQQVTQALRPVRGPVRFLNLGGPGSSDASPELLLSPESVVQPMVLDNPPNDMEQAESKEVVMDEPAMADHDDDPGASDEAQAKAETDSGSHEPSTLQQPQTQASAAADTHRQQQTHTTKEEEAPKDRERERSRSPPPKAAALQSYNLARKLDGMPQVDSSDPRFLSYMKSIDEELIADAINEKHLSPEDRKAFDEAKNKALQVWIDNQAWRAVDRSEAQEGELVPARMLQRWKPTKDGKVANCRVIIQGFRHRDVLESELEKESPTLSRIGRMLIMQWTCQLQFKLFSAGVKSAFMQSDSIDQETRIYIQPSADMRRRLSSMMGLRDHQVLKATKPAFGDVRAPRQWYQTADHYLTEELLMVHHPLDRCIYLSVRTATKDDNPFQVFYNKENEALIVDGYLGLHVDDFIGAGEGIQSPQDVQGFEATDEAPTCFAARLRLLSQRFRFGSWDFGEQGHMLFCGTEVKQGLNWDQITLSLKQYIHRLKPATLEKTRKATPEAPLDEKEHRTLRAIIGALAWPAGQCLPQLSASISILQASASSPTVQDLLTANKVLRFAKEVVQNYVLTLRKHGSSLADLQFGAYTDASWSVRPDGSSQGGYLLFVASANELASEKPMALTILDWQSRKLPRMCRSSLSAESQASSAAVDELEWLKVFAAAMVDPFINISEDSTMSKFGPSPLITDAKSLFDAARSVSSGLRLSEKRTAIEVTIVRERLEALGGHWRWVNSAQQLADGLTKPTSRENFAEQLRRGVHQLKFDPTYTAAKKVGRDARNQELEEHEAVSKQLFGEALLGEVVHDETVCLLPECNKKVEKKHGHEKYCSRRHFYKHRHRSELLNDDVWRKSALTACGILTCEALPKAAALQVHVEIEDGDALKFFFTFMILVLCFSFGLKDRLQQVLLTMFNWVIHPPVENQAEEIFEPEAEDATRRHEILNDNDPAIPEIENDGEEPEVEDSPHRHDAGSSTVNDDTDLDDEEWARWQRIKAAVIEEPSQHFWRRRLEKARDFRNKEVDIHTRTIVVNEDFTNSRIRRYKETHQVEDTHHVTEEEIACWNRQFNRSLRFIYDAGWHVSLKRKERDEMEYTENLVTRLSFFEVHDKIVQTPLTFDPNLGRNQFVTARPHEHGAYEFHNDFYPHIR